MNEKIYMSVSEYEKQPQTPKKHRGWLIKLLSGICRTAAEVIYAFFIMAVFLGPLLLWMMFCNSFGLS